MPKSSTLRCFVVLALLPLVAPHLKSQALFTSPSSGSSGSISNTFGFAFTVGQSSLRVSALGVYDENGNGLVNSNTVGIWTDSGTLLGSATVSAGSGGTLTSNFRYISVTPFDLISGQSYRIGAFSAPFNEETGFINVFLPTNGFAMSGDITLIGQVRSVSYTPAFAFPTDGPFSGQLAVRGNALYSVITAVPEPSTYAAIFGLASLGFAAYRRRKSPL